MSVVSRVHLPSLAPGQETCVVMEVHAPHSPGQHQCMWRATLPGGALFGGKTTRQHFSSNRCPIFVNGVGVV